MCNSDCEKKLKEKLGVELYNLGKQVESAILTFGKTKVMAAINEFVDIKNIHLHACNDFKISESKEVEANNLCIHNHKHQN